MATLDGDDWAEPIAAELLGHVSREYPGIDGSTMRRAFLIAAVELSERIKAAARERSWGDARPPSASANPWQGEDD